MASAYLNALKKQLSEGWITQSEYQQLLAKHNASQDPAQAGTDKILADIEKRTHEAYEQAWKEMYAKQQKRLENFQKACDKNLELWQKGEITEAEFKTWKTRQFLMNKDIEAVVNGLAKDMHNANQIAAKIATEGMADVYALNANYAMYDILKQGGASNVAYNTYAKIMTGGDIPSMGASWTLYNHDTAELLLKEEWALSAEKGKSSLLPEPSKKKKKELKELAKTSPDELWNRQKFQSAVLQGVLQGESPAALAFRLSGVGKMNERQAIRNARTMTTNVQNMGRNRSYLNAKDMGINLVIEWVATLDGATRHSHRQLHGEQKPNNKTAKFSNGCRWPGDPQGPAAEVYNCRCTTVSWVKGHESTTVTESEWMKQNGQSFEEWQKGAKPGKASTPEKTPKPAKAATPKPSAPPPVPPTPPPPPPPTPKNGPEAKDPYASAIQNAKEYKDWQHEDDNFSMRIWNDVLTDEERRGIQRYTGASYRRMNEILRGQEPFDPNAVDRAGFNFGDLINGCTDGLNHQKLKHDTKLYRGMGSNRTLGRALGFGEDTTADQIHDLVTSGNIKGMRFVEKGFCSTGINADAGWDKDVVMEIIAPKGTKGMYVDPISKNQGEQECLLQRGAIFRIHNAEYLDDGTLKLHVLVEGFEKAKPF